MDLGLLRGVLYLNRIPLLPCIMQVGGSDFKIQVEALSHNVSNSLWALDRQDIRRM